MYKTLSKYACHLQSGNKKVNKYWEKNFNGRKPDGNASNMQISNFIKDKYVLKKWIDEDAEDPVQVYLNGPTKKKSKGKKKVTKKKKHVSETESEEEEDSDEEPVQKKPKAKAPAKKAPAKAPA